MNEKNIQLSLTILFYLLAIATIVIYFALPENRTPMFYTGFGALGVRVITYILKYFF